MRRTINILSVLIRCAVMRRSRDSWTKSPSFWLRILVIVVVFVVGCVAAAAMMASSEARRGHVSIDYYLVLLILISSSIGLSMCPRLIPDRAEVEFILSSPAPARALYIVQFGGGFCRLLFVFFVFAAAPTAVVAGIAGLNPLWAVASCLTTVAIIFSGITLVFTLATRVVGAKRAALAATYMSLCVWTAVLLWIEGQSVFVVLSEPINRLTSEVGSLWFVKTMEASVRGDHPAGFTLVAILLALFCFLVLMPDRICRGALASEETGPWWRGYEPRMAMVNGTEFAMCVRELRLMLRDANLVTRVGPSIVYLVFVGILLVRYRGVTGLAPLSALVAALVAPRLAAALSSREECPELIASSPVKKHRLVIGKGLAAAFAPTTVALGSCISLILASHPVLALTTLVFSSGGAFVFASLRLSGAASDSRLTNMAQFLRTVGANTVVAIIALIVVLGLFIGTTGFWAAGTGLLMIAAGICSPLAYLTVSAADDETRHGRHCQSDTRRKDATNGSR